MKFLPFRMSLRDEQFLSVEDEPIGLIPVTLSLDLPAIKGNNHRLQEFWMGIPMEIIIGEVGNLCSIAVEFDDICVWHAAHKSPRAPFVKAQNCRELCQVVRMDIESFWHYLTERRVSDGPFADF